jgi:hypothetical protein
MHLQSVSQETKKTYPVITLRTNPLSFLEGDGGVTPGAGIQLNERWAVNMDPTFIFYSLYDFDNNNATCCTIKSGGVSGIKLRGELRYYFRDYLYGKRGWFGAIEIHYKKVASRKWTDFGINNVNGQYDFFQYAWYNEVKTEAGIAAKMGWLVRLWSPRWASEFYTGIGLKFRHVTQRNQPAGASFLYSPAANSVFGNGALPLFPIGIKLVYRIF